MEEALKSLPRAPISNIHTNSPGMICAITG